MELIRAIDANNKHVSSKAILIGAGESTTLVVPMMHLVAIITAKTDKYKAEEIMQQLGINYDAGD